MVRRREYPGWLANPQPLLGDPSDWAWCYEVGVDGAIANGFYLRLPAISIRVRFVSIRGGEHLSVGDHDFFANVIVDVRDLGIGRCMIGLLLFSCTFWPALYRFMFALIIARTLQGLAPLP